MQMRTETLEVYTEEWNELCIEKKTKHNEVKQKIEIIKSIRTGTIFCYIKQHNEIVKVHTRGETGKKKSKRTKRR